MTAARSMLEAESLVGGYGDLTVVRDVSLSVTAGSITALLGRNGAGKTTTLRLISGLSALQGGRVTFDGVEIGSMPAHRRSAGGLGFVQEGKRIFRERTVEENLVIGAYSARLDRQQLAVAIADAYDRFPVLGEKRAIVAGVLSGGQQQMLAIAQALMPSPRVLMLDEPTTGLAPTIVDELFALIGRLRAEGLAVLLVEQAVDFCLDVADTAVIINLGRVVHTGSTDDPEARTAATRAYMAELT